MSWSSIFVSNTVLPLVTLACTTWMFSRTLPTRSGTGWRTVVVAAAVVGFLALCAKFDFSIFPELTDLWSYLNAIGMFACALAACIAGQLFIWDCPPLTSLFVCSMAYSLENIAMLVERLVAIYLFSSSPNDADYSIARLVLIVTCVLAIAWRLLIRNLRAEGLLQIDNPVKVLAGALTFLINICFDLVVKDLGVLDIPAHYQVVLNLFYLFICVFAMYAVSEIVYNRQLQTNLALVDQLRQTQAEQYRLSQENIAAINRKLHDIRHSVARLEVDRNGLDPQEAADIVRSIDVYDSKVRTQNDALDVILTERGLVCENLGISLACIADGGALGFMPSADLYSLFGSLLDRAIEVVKAVKEPDRRRIALRVTQGPGVVIVNLEHTATDNGENEPRKLPAPAALIADNYGATTTMRLEDGTFHLNVMLSMPA